ncbi:MAG TPA: YceI family protein [Streptosporangiaceae bacterium]|jgi:polyisoprenoid-binding protein YceI
MAPSENMTASALQELLSKATLAGDWTLDTARSTVALSSKSVWGLVPVKGVFRDVTGHGTISESGEVSGTLTVAAASIDTKMAKRDAHLRSADFFDTDKHRDIVFQADQVQPAAAGVKVTGTLTVRGQAKPVTFDATVAVHDGDEVWLDGQAQINRADYGLTWNRLGMSAVDNTLTVHAVFSRK